MKALEINKNLESFKVSISVSDHDFPYRCRKATNPDYGYGLSSKILDSLKQNKGLKVLHLQELLIDPRIGLQISEMSHLKSLQLSMGPIGYAVVTPEIVDAIANNFNQLENIEIWNWQFENFGNDLKRAFNRILENNCQTLKRIKVRFHPVFCRY